MNRSYKNSRYDDMDFKRPRLASKTIGGEDKYTRQDYSEKHGYNDDNARSHYQPKLMSKIAVVISSESGKASNGSGEHNEGVNDRWSPTNVIVIEKPTIQEAYTKPDTISRNKRMFGNLMGHLGKARKILDSDSNMIGKQDQQKIAATIKNQAESKRVFHLHVTEKREEKQREKLLRAKNIAKQQKNEISNQAISWRRKERVTEKYILTTASPRLAWIPGRGNHAICEELLVNRVKEMVEAFAAREESDANRVAAIDEDIRRQEIEFEQFCLDNAKSLSDTLVGQGKGQGKGQGQVGGEGGDSKGTDSPLANSDENSAGRDEGERALSQGEVGGGGGEEEDEGVDNEEDDGVDNEEAEAEDLLAALDGRAGK